MIFLRFSLAVCKKVNSLRLIEFADLRRSRQRGSLYTSSSFVRFLGKISHLNALMLLDKS
ncbi:MAG TPA: hypothetical protein V6D25_06885 [Leptolyngbyaceae cyanobacterium]